MTVQEMDNMRGPVPHSDADTNGSIFELESRSAPSNKTNGLLDLPSELIYEIIDFALSSPWPIVDTGDRHPAKWGVENTRMPCYMLQGERRAPDCSSLLLANKRLHAETTSFLSRSKTSRTLNIDVADMSKRDDGALFPAFRNIPPPPIDGVLEKVVFNVKRYWCAPEFPPFRLCYGHEDLPQQLEQLLLLLSNFVAPTWKNRMTATSRPWMQVATLDYAPFHIETVVLNMDMMLLDAGGTIWTRQPEEGELPILKGDLLVGREKVRVFDALPKLPIHWTSCVESCKPNPVLRELSHLALALHWVKYDDGFPITIGKIQFCFEEELVHELDVAGFREVLRAPVEY